MMTSLGEAGRLRPGARPRDGPGCLLVVYGGDVYRMLVHERGWSPQKYEDRLADTLVHSLLTPGRPNPVRSRPAQP